MRKESYITKAQEIQAGIDIEKIKAYLVFYSKYKFVKKEIINKLNKEQTALL